MQKGFATMLAKSSTQRLTGVKCNVGSNLPSCEIDLDRIIDFDNGVGCKVVNIEPPKTGNFAHTISYGACIVCHEES